jgi:hypothetical protein
VEDFEMKVVLLLILFVAITFGMAILAFPVKWLWNWLMPDLFHLARITALQAWGLLTLCGLLFKSSSASSKS